VSQSPLLETGNGMGQHCGLDIRIGRHWILGKIWTLKDREQGVEPRPILGLGMSLVELSDACQVTILKSV